MLPRSVSRPPVRSAVWAHGLRGLGRRVWAGLVLAMLLAALLGQLHRVHHPGWRAVWPGAGSAVARPLAEPPPGQHLPAAVGAPAARWLDRLFPGHSSDADCLLFDQLSQDGPSPSPWVAQALPAPTIFLAWWLDATLVAATAAPCQARAPPLSR